MVEYCFTFLCFSINISSTFYLTNICSFMSLPWCRSLLVVLLVFLTGMFSSRVCFFNKWRSMFQVYSFFHLSTCNVATELRIQNNLAAPFCRRSKHGWPFISSSFRSITNVLCCLRTYLVSQCLISFPKTSVMLIIGVLVISTIMLSSS